MKKILALFLTLTLLCALAGCAETTNVTVEDPAKIMVEKEGGSVAITLTDEKTVDRITSVVCKIPLQEAEPTEDQWSYRITWQDAEGSKITQVTLAGAQIRWEGKSYNLSVGVDLSVITDVLETIPGLNK